jgi:hypothetical protein
MKGLAVVSGVFSLFLVTGCNGPAAPSPAGVVSSATSALASSPFKGAFEGTQSATPGTPPFVNIQMTGEGQGTHVGRFEIALPHTVNVATASATGTCTIVAADGSRIIASFTGQAQVGPTVSIVEQATITGGTGRFADASGTFTIRRTYVPATGVTTGAFEGTLSLTK